MVSKKEPSERGFVTGVVDVRGSKLLSSKHVFKLSRSNWIKKSTLLFKPNLNFRRSAFDFRPETTSKVSLYQRFLPKEREPYLKARAEFMDGNDFRRVGNFVKVLNKIRSRSASVVSFPNKLENIVSGVFDSFTNIGVKRFEASPPVVCGSCTALASSLIQSLDCGWGVGYGNGPGRQASVDRAPRRLIYKVRSCCLI